MISRRIISFSSKSAVSNQLFLSTPHALPPLFSHSFLTPSYSSSSSSSSSPHRRYTTTIVKESPLPGGESVAGGGKVVKWDEEIDYGAYFRRSNKYSGEDIKSDIHNEEEFSDDEIIKPPHIPMASKIREKKIDEFGRSYGTGKRKTSIARVWIKEGSGEMIVNDMPFIDYFQPNQREHALGSFLASRTAGKFDVWCTVKGGGMSGQSGAVRLGIARALEAFEPTLRLLLRPAGMLTRDSRRVERKKPGQKKARKQFQWVKR